MNKRTKKKLERRLGYKKYSEYRIARIRKIISNDYPNDPGETSLIYIVVNGKRPNNKHFRDIKLLRHINPISSTPGLGENKETKEFTLEFTAGESLNNNTEMMNQEGSVYRDIFKSWTDGLKEEN